MKNSKTAKTPGTKDKWEERADAKGVRCNEPAAVAPIEWPQQWLPHEGFPLVSNGLTPDGKYTWAELDAVLRKHGSSLAERIEALGRRNTRH